MNDGLRQRDGFTLVELLVVISIIAIIAGLVLPVLMRGTGEAYKIQCTNNLKNIYPAAQGYAAKKYSFPRDKSVDDPTAHDSLNILLKSLQGRGLEPKLFKCPVGDAEPATADPETGKFLLDEDTLDYAWAMKKTSNTRTVPLSSDKYSKSEDTGGHDGYIQVLFTDSHIETWEVEDPELEDKLEDGIPRGLGR